MIMLTKLRLILIFLMVAVMLLTMSGQALAQPQLVKVIIVFSKPTALMQEDSSVASKEIRGFGGQVRRQFSIIPAMSASIPRFALSSIRRLPGVALVEEDRICYAVDQSVPWGIDRVGADTVHSYNTGAGVKVAIIDSGIDLEHEDLQVYGGYNAISPGSSVDDDYGHGTHVAGTVAALDNDIGVLGMAPEAQLYAVKVLNYAGSGYWSDVIEGIQWAVDNDMQVINMSLGGSSSSYALEDACDAAEEAGVVVVAAAGNSGSSYYRSYRDLVLYPAKYNSVIAVAATDTSDERAYFSSYGPAVELAAPGYNILSTYYGNTLTTKSGTSMASPHVAGLAALIIASNTIEDGDYGNSNGRINDEVRERMRRTASQYPNKDNQLGYGLINAPAAVPEPTNILPTAPEIDVTPDLPFTNQDLVATITNGSTDEDNDPITYSYAWFENDVEQEGLTTDTVPSTLTASGNVWRCEVTPHDGTGYGEAGSDEVIIQNSPPVADAGSNHIAKVDAWDTLDGSASYDPDEEDDLSYNWTQTDGAEVTISNPSEESASFMPPSVGDYTFELEVSDGIANSTAEVVVTAETNHLPTAPEIDVTPDLPFTNQDLVATITNGSTDEDNDPITYSYAWFENDVEQEGLTTDTVPSTLTASGNVWRCEVTPHDGTGYGEAGSDEVIIQNSPPVADAQSVNTIEDTSVVIILTGSDMDSDPLTFAIDTGPASGGSLAPAEDFASSGNVTYTPTLGYTDSDSFTFTVSDLSETDSATVSIMVESSAPTMHVDNITMTLYQLWGGWRTYAQATVSVVDKNGDPVDANITAHWEGATTDTESGATGADGMITFKSNYRRRPPSGTEFIFNIDTVTKPDWEYDYENSVLTGKVIVP